MAIFPSFGLDGENLGGRGGGEGILWVDLVGIVGLSRSLNRVAKDWESGKRGHGRMKGRRDM